MESFIEYWSYMEPFSCVNKQVVGTVSFIRSCVFMLTICCLKLLVLARLTECELTGLYIVSHKLVYIR